MLIYVNKKMDSDTIIRQSARLFNCKCEEVISEIKKLISDIDQMESGNITDPALKKKLKKLANKHQGKERAKQIRKAKKNGRGF